MKLKSLFKLQFQRRRFLVRSQFVLIIIYFNQLCPFKRGDDFFFRKNKRQARINHVGLVINISNNKIEFIHSTTSKGVITSLLSERYWNKAFVEARRVL